MARYAFTFKKDDVFVEFVTSDKDVVERQFQIWVSDADDFVNGRLKKNYNIASQFKSESFGSPTPAPSIVEEVKSEPITVEPQPELQPEPQFVAETVVEPEVKTEEVVAQEPQPTVAPEESMPQIEPKIEQVEETPSFTSPVIPESVQTEEEVTDFVQFEINKEGAVQDPAVQQQELTEEPEVFDQASSLLKTINTIQNPPQEEKPTTDFEAVLDKTIENPTFEPTKVKDPVFLNLLQSKKTEDKFNFLIITAYYLSEFEKMERFSLKQINAKLMQNVSVIIEHPILQDAINKNLLEVIPDLTGVAEVAEYRLTRVGEEFFANII